VLLALAIAILDDPGDGSPRVKRARLRAASFIRDGLSQPAKQTSTPPHPIRGQKPGPIYAVQKLSDGHRPVRVYLESRDDDHGPAAGYVIASDHPE
jgi:hypothetical protein